MIKITPKKLEKIMFDNFNKKVSYLGVLCEKDMRRSRPKKFCFMEWHDDSVSNITLIQEKHVLGLIN